MTATEKRLESLARNIEQTTKKLDRIKIALSTGKNPYSYSEYDMKRTTRELDDLLKSKVVYEAKKVEEDNKAASRNIAVIIEFLDGWKARVTAHYDSLFTEYYEAKAAVRKAFETRPAYGEPEYEEAYTRACELSKKFSEQCSREYIKGTYPKEYKYGKYYSIQSYVNGKTYEEAKKRLEAELTKEANTKYDYLVERACFYVGTITDAAGLSVGMNGELNGIIIGTDGKCKVETIGAGGYNIQCWHMRVLVHKYTTMEKQPKSTPKQSKQPNDQSINWSDKTTQELEEIAKERGIAPKQYENPAIYRMRLVMSLKGGK